MAGTGRALAVPPLVLDGNVAWSVPKAQTYRVVILSKSEQLNASAREAWHLSLSSSLPPDEDSASYGKNVCRFTRFCCKLPPR